MNIEIAKAINDLRAIEVERELTPREETRLVALLRCRADDIEEELEKIRELESEKEEVAK